MVQEKDYLLRELNHRVKNNLLMVRSLISLKDSSMGNAVDLSDIRNQVDAIEKIHEALQASDHITHINLKSYVTDILSSLFRMFTAKQVSVENHVPEIAVRTKVAVLLGLIINETATNAVKHGFTQDDEQRFTVSLEETSERDQYVLTIANTGEPFPGDIDIENPETLGLRLISALVSQLRGTLDVQRQPHPVFTVRFPAEQLKAE